MFDFDVAYGGMSKMLRLEKLSKKRLLGAEEKKLFVLVRETEQ